MLLTSLPSSRHCDLNLWEHGCAEEEDVKSKMRMSLLPFQAFLQQESHALHHLVRLLVSDAVVLCPCFSQCSSLDMNCWLVGAVATDRCSFIAVLRHIHTSCTCIALFLSPQRATAAHVSGLADTVRAYPSYPLPGRRRRRQGACRSKQQYDGSQTQQRLDSLIWQSREAEPHRTTILLPRILLRASEGCTSNVCGADVDAVQWSNVSICS